MVTGTHLSWEDDDDDNNKHRINLKNTAVTVPLYLKDGTCKRRNY